MNSLFSSTILALLCFGHGITYAEKTPSLPPLPAKATKVTDFVPERWAEEVLLDEDFTGDKVKDLAVVVQQKNPDGFAHRVLVLALRDKDGSLQRTAVSDEAALDADEGGIWGDPFVGIRAERGALVIEHYGGSNWRWSLVRRYRYQQARWQLIGATDENFFAGDDHYLSSVDRNLSTGLVKRVFHPLPDYPEESLSLQERLMAKNPEATYWQVTAPFRHNRPLIDGRVEAKEWPVARLKFGSKKQIVSGAADWQGTADWSALLRASVGPEDLCLLAEVTDDQVTAGDQVRMLSLGGKEIVPDSVKRQTTPGGFIQECRWSRMGLQKALPGVDSFWLQRGADDVLEEDVPEELPVTFTFHDEDGSPVPTVFSSRPAASAFAAGIYLTAEPALILAND